MKRVKRLAWAARLACVAVVTVTSGAGAAVAQGATESGAGEDDAYIVVGAQKRDGTGVVRIFTDPERDGTYQKRVDEFAPYTARVTGQVRVAAGDPDGDGEDEFAVATGNRRPIKIYEIGDTGPAGRLGTIAAQGSGAFIAFGDINADGRDELITGAGRGRPRVRIFSDTNGDGVPSQRVNGFRPYGNRTAGGARVAAGDLDEDGRDEVIVGPGRIRGNVKVYNNTDGDLEVSDDGTSEGFRPYGKKFERGVYLASGAHISGAGTTGDELVIAPQGSRKQVKAFTDSDGDGSVSDNPLFERFRPYGRRWAGGARAALEDTDDSGSFGEVVVVPGASGKRLLKIFDDDGDAGDLISDNPRDDHFTPFPKSIRSGMFVAVARTFVQAWSSTDVPLAIPDQGDAGDPLTTSIFVPGSAGFIEDLNVFLSIDHTFNADLDVTLTHVPSGTSVVLFTDIGNNDDGIHVLLSDESGTDIGAVPDDPDDNPVVGSFNPEGSAQLSAFDDLDGSGEWQLTLDDDAGALTGTLLNWTLILG